MAYDPNVSGQEINQLSKPLKGIVVNNKDPRQLRRVQVKVEGVVESQKLDALPWASPAGGGTAGRRANLGDFEVPAINSSVQITYPDGDINTPQYTAYSDDIADGQIQKLYTEDYPNTRGKIEEDGTWDRQNKTKGYEEHFHKSGYYVQTDAGGNVMINIPGNVSIKVGGQICLKVASLMAINVGDKLGVKANTEIGFTAGTTFGADSGEATSLQGSHIHLNDGIVYGTVASCMSVLNSAIEGVDNRMKECQKLRDYLKEKGDASKQAIGDYSNAMTGNKKA